MEWVDPRLRDTKNVGQPSINFICRKINSNVCKIVNITKGGTLVEIYTATVTKQQPEQEQTEQYTTPFQILCHYHNREATVTKLPELKQ